jgi:3-oxoadipate enol-lactonase
MKEHFLQERGIYYRVSDLDTDAPVIVFVHGLTGSSSAWRGYEERFEKSHRIISYDLRGHGASQKPPRYTDYGAHHHVEDLSALLKHLDVRDFILVSHSYGTLIALEFLLTKPIGALGAVFFSPTFDLRNIPLQKLTDLVLRIGAHICSVFPVHSKQGSHVDYAKYRNTGDWNMRRMLADIRNTTARVTIFCLDLLCHSESVEKWKQLTVPAHIIHGGRDSVIPVAHARKLAETLTSSQLIVLPNANHVLVLNDIAEVSAILEKALSTLAPQREEAELVSVS